MPSSPPQFAQEFAREQDPIDEAELLRAGFATVVHRDAVETTMTEARLLAADSARPLPAVVVADRQLLGRGRRGACWWQAGGSLAASLVVAARGEDTGPRPTWSLACGIALAEAIAAVEPAVEPLLRWPNDVEVGGRKLAGILVETVSDARAIFGIGVNTAGSAAAAPEPLRRRLVTLPDLTGRMLPRARLLVALLPRLLELLDLATSDPQALMARYRPRCGLAGRTVTIHIGAQSHQGLCRGIADTGALVIDTPAGRMEFSSGSLTAPADVWQPG